MCRGVMPRMSAACNQLSFPSIAFRMTSSSSLLSPPGRRGARCFSSNHHRRLEADIFKCLCSGHLHCFLQARFHSVDALGRIAYRHLASNRSSLVRSPALMKHPKTIQPAEGRLAVLMPGLGAVATTTIAGVLLARKGLGEPIGSLTQLGTIRLGRRTEGRV